MRFEDDSVIIDYKSLYENQFKVIERYKFEEELHQMIDRFIPQIVEEHYELLFELDKKEVNRRETALELLDIILYLISVNSSLIKYYITDSTFNSSSENVYFEIDELESYDRIRNYSNELIFELGRIRRLVPNRKYHKKKEEITKDEISKISISIFRKLEMQISRLLHLLFISFGDETYSIISKMKDVIKNK